MSSEFEREYLAWRKAQRSPGSAFMRVIGMVRLGLLFFALGFVWFGIFDFAIPELQAFVAEVHRLRAVR